MSTDVYIQLVRKSDGCPYERVYMGGGGLAKELEEDELEATTMGCYAMNLGDRASVQAFITVHFDVIDRYGGVTDVTYLSDEDFYYWLVVES